MLELPYVAGLFDGEGCFSVQFNKPTGHQSVNTYATVTNTNRSVLELLQVQFGGSICELSGRQLKWKQGYSWRLTGAKALAFVESIEPWLVIKKEQAVLAKLIDVLRPRGEHNALGVKQWPQDIVKATVARGHELNFRGAQCL